MRADSVDLIFKALSNPQSALPRAFQEQLEFLRNALQPLKNFDGAGVGVEAQDASTKEFLVFEGVERLPRIQNFGELLNNILPADIQGDYQIFYDKRVMSRFNTLPPQSINQVVTFLQRLRHENQAVEWLHQVLIQTHLLYILGSKSVEDLNYRIEPENFLNTFRYLALKYYEKDSYIRDIAVSARERKESYRDHEVFEEDLERFENVTYLLQCFEAYECHERVIIDRTIFLIFLINFKQEYYLEARLFGMIIMMPKRQR